MLAPLGTLSGQIEHPLSTREVRIGKLIGETGERELEIHTQHGTFKVFGADNGRPFKAFRRSPNEIVVTFSLSPFISSSSPNKLIYRFFETERQLISAIILDEIDFAVLENEASAHEVDKSNKKFVPVVVRLTNKLKMICYNHRNPLLSNREARVALSMAINHGSIIDNRFLNGKATIARGPFDDTSPLYHSGMSSYKHDPRQALKLLTTLGWHKSKGQALLNKDGESFMLDLYYKKGISMDEVVARQIEINLLKIGVQVNPKPLSMKQINDRLNSGTFDAIILDYTFEDTVESIKEFFSEAGAKNYMGYRSGPLENVIRSYDAFVNEGRPNTLVKGMQRIINEDQPVTFLYFKWVTHKMVNKEKFIRFRYLTGEARPGDIRPFDEWTIKSLVRQ